MVEILAFAFGIMYTPGPVNLISLNAGINGQAGSTLRFCVGVGCAMGVLLLIFGYSGAWLLTPRYQLLISSAGSLYIVYLAYKIGRASLQPFQEQVSAKFTLNFKSGLMMQLLNTKAFIVILPITAVQFPAANISGSAIFVWSLLLAAMAFGAPSSYWILGGKLGKLIKHSRYFQRLNMIMALLLLYVAIDIAYQHVYLPLL